LTVFYFGNRLGTYSTENLSSQRIQAPGDPTSLVLTIERGLDCISPFVKGYQCADDVASGVALQELRLGAKTLPAPCGSLRGNALLGWIARTGSLSTIFSARNQSTPVRNPSFYIKRRCHRLVIAVLTPIFIVSASRTRKQHFYRASPSACIAHLAPSHRIPSEPLSGASEQGSLCQRCGQVTGVNHGPTRQTNFPKKASYLPTLTHKHHHVRLHERSSSQGRQRLDVFGACCARVR